METQNHGFASVQCCNARQVGKGTCKNPSPFLLFPYKPVQIVPFSVWEFLANTHAEIITSSDIHESVARALSQIEYGMASGLRSIFEDFIDFQTLRDAEAMT